MTFKKRGPGCPCECGETPCNERCIWKCIGEICSPVCPIRIEMPTPDTVNSLDTEPDTGCISDDTDCPNSAPCYACIATLDGLIRITPSVQVTDCNNFDITVPIYGQGAFRTEGLQNALITWNCWQPTFTNCPYITEFEDPQPDPPCWPSAISLSSNGAFGTGGANARVIHTWDGECGEITIEIIYYAVLSKCQQTIPIPDPCDPSSDLVNISTKYTHTFKLEYCTCEQLYANFAYIGVVSENSCHGITVPDPCNTESATLYLEQDCNYACACYDCDDTLYLTIAGTQVNGTFAFGSNFNPTGNFFRYTQCYGTPSCVMATVIYNDSNEEVGTAVLFLYCYPCNKYSATLFIYCSDLDDACTAVEYETDPFSCGETASFTKKDKVPINPCFSYDDHTFSLS